MTVCSVHPTEVDDVGALASRILGRRVTSVVRLGGGRNSRVYAVECGPRRRYAVKQYFATATDARRRLEVEFTGLCFLWRHGIRAIPRPITADTDSASAVYEYVEGRRIPTATVTDADIDCAARFLGRLKILSAKRASRDLPNGSEACFSLSAIVGNISQRLGRLWAVRGGSPEARALQMFLGTEFEPVFREVTTWCSTRLAGSGLARVSALSFAKRTLSPSDFGFHNALRRADGSVVFLDFEYFGWDDPAKMVSDFLLHPAMRLPRPLGRRFLARVVERFSTDRSLGKRVELVWPLWGLKWCLILLNEFVPADLGRRTFAAGREASLQTSQRRQLTKARRMLATVSSDYGRFPYGE